MKINSDNTTEAIKKVKPNLKDNSIKQYEIHLKKLKNLFESDNYDFLSEPKDVMEKIKERHFTSQRNTLNAIIILLLALNHDGEFDKLIADYQKIRDKFNEQYLENQQSGKISENQAKNFADLSEIDDMLKKMENEIKESKLKKKENLTGKDKELLMVYTIYTFLKTYPLRLDLAGMEYISKTVYNKLSEEQKKNTNYLVNEKNKLTAILNEYKTSKKYGEKKIEIDKAVEKVLRMYIKLTGKTTGDVLFVSSTGKPLSRNALTQLLMKTSKKYLNKSISTTMMRKVVLSDKFGELKKEQEKMAEITGHDVGTMNSVYIKEKDED